MNQRMGTGNSGSRCRFRGLNGSGYEDYRDEGSRWITVLLIRCTKGAALWEIVEERNRRIERNLSEC